MFRKRNRATLIQHLIGMTVGILVCTVTFYYSQYELNYDSYHAKKDRLFRVRNHTVIVETGEEQNKRATSYFGVAEALKQEIPQVLNATNIYSESATIISQLENYRINKVLFSNSSFFNMFSIQILLGNVQDMDSPNGIFISSTLAKTLFGNENPIGKPLKYLGLRTEGQFDLIIKGVFEDVPENSYFKNTEIFVPMKIFRNFHSPTLHWASLTLKQVNWRWSDFYTFIELQEDFEREVVSEKIQNLFDRNRKELDNQSGRQQLSIIEPINEIHLVTGLNNELEDSVNRSTLNLFFGIGILVMMIAWINFVNISTATAINRSKEIGIKKVVGAFHGQLIGQFLLESLILTFITFVSSIIILFIFSNQISYLLGLQLSIDVRDIKFFVILLSFLLLGSTIASFYPAIVLSSINTIDVLKNYSKNNTRRFVIRKFLVVLQFAIVGFLITCLLAANSQFNYMLNKNLGINIDQKVGVRLPSSVFRESNFKLKANRFAENINKLKQVSSISSSTVLPGDINRWRQTITLKGYEDRALHFNRIAVSIDYIKSLDLQLNDGRWFDISLTSDYSTALIINQEGMKQLGFNIPNDIIGKRVSFPAEQEDYEIIGVVEDFHHSSLHSTIEPIAFQLDSLYQGNSYIIQFSGDPSKLIEVIEQRFVEAFPQEPFNYIFLNDHFKKQYDDDIRFRNLFQFFTFVALLLAILGLIALSNYALKLQIKSVGIKLVLGAGKWSISRELFKEYLVLSALSCLVSIPIAYFNINNWLDSFEYQTTLSPIIYLIPLFSLTFIVLLTVSRHISKVVNTSPTKTLRSE